MGDEETMLGKYVCVWLSYQPIFATNQTRIYSNGGSPVDQLEEPKPDPQDQDIKKRKRKNRDGQVVVKFLDNLVGAVASCAVKSTRFLLVEKGRPMSEPT